MIQIKELRIGNLINLGKVEQLDNSIDEVYYSGDGYYQSTYCCNIKPILLTEKWLLNFGFIKCENEYWFEKDILSLNLIGTINIQGRKYSECVIQHGIKYVHQLQNLFFVLTGEDLVVSDSVS